MIASEVNSINIVKFSKFGFRHSFHQQNCWQSGRYEIHTCNTLCSSSSPVITSTLSNRIFSPGLEIWAAADSVCVAFLNKAVPVGKEKERKIKEIFISVEWVFLACMVACEFSTPCGIQCHLVLFHFCPTRRKKSWNTAKCLRYSWPLWIEWGSLEDAVICPKGRVAETSPEQLEIDFPDKSGF